LATLGLGFLGAALTGGVGAAATPLAAGLAGGVAGNLATDLFKHIDRKVCERFLDGWSGIDENHHVVAALRLAQIDALRALIARFEGSLGKEDDRLGDQAGFAFAARVKSFLAEETKVAQARNFSSGGEDIEARKAVIALLPDTFDDALAARHDSSERGEAGSAIAQVRAIVETAVLDELHARCGDGAKRIPALFEDLFLGKEPAAGWFDLFVRDAADKLTHPNSEFAAIWNAEQTALIKAYVEALNIQSTDISIQIDKLRADFDTGTASISETLDVVEVFSEKTHELVKAIHANLVGIAEQAKADARLGTFELAFEIPAHVGRILSLTSFKSDSKMVSLGSDNSISVWSTDEGRQLASIPVDGPSLSGCVGAFVHANGFCSSGHDAYTHFWSEDGEPAYVDGFAALGPPSHERIVFSPNGERFAAIDHFGWVKVYNATTREQVGGVGAHKLPDLMIPSGYQKDYTTALCYSPDGSLIATGGGDSQIKIWPVSNIETMERKLPREPRCTMRGHTKKISHIFFAYDGQHLISSSDDHTIAIWDTQKERQVGRLTGHSMWISAMAICGDFVISASPKHYDKENRRLTGGELILWDWRTRKMIHRLDEEFYVSALTSSALKNLFVSGGCDGRIRVWSLGVSK
jgi:WD40 repeat protein